MIVGLPVQSATGRAQRATRGARRGGVVSDLRASQGSKAGEVACEVGINPNHAQTIVANLVRERGGNQGRPAVRLVTGKASARRTSATRSAVTAGRAERSSSVPFPVGFMAR